MRNAFDQAVKMRLMADVPVGAFLSGGIDSTSVVASMAMQSPQPVKTFSIGFEEPGFNELSLAAALARKYGTEHQEMMVRPVFGGAGVASWRGTLTNPLGIHPPFPPIWFPNSRPAT